ncbi:MAG: hypothetical protein GYA17_11400 [Chloroflexi bacterium]|jgi:aspartyl-tRNA(Asn)/glutamyl-tRNA(Gln) amidotransferase subunit C|nr:aspartyl/glutamyl-tRNA amidotransferase subunit C [Anaerolineaceae bacterium]NMB88958.1 hypothetical protein [Chloroflexota bacterium]
MSDQIDRNTFDHLVLLAALDMGTEQAEYLRQELNHQLKVIRELAAIPLDEATPATSHGVPYTADIRQSVREDVWQPYPAPEEIIGQAPQVDDGYIVVPDIPHTKLD